MSFLGAAAAGGATATVGAIVVAGVTGAIAAGALTFASTQVAANVTQPHANSHNLHNVNAPSYAD